MRRDPMRNVVWYEWRERIDSQAYAMVATATETWRGGVYSASTMLLVPGDVPPYKVRGCAVDKLRGEMESLLHVRQVSRGYVMHRFGMPHRGWVRDLQR